MKKFKAVLFDLDGTLVRTMEAYFWAWKNACMDFGFEISERDYYPLEGMEASKLAKTLCGKYASDERNIEKIIERKKEYFIKMFVGRKSKLYPGAAELLTELKAKNIPMALVTASVRDQINASVSSEILVKFNALVTGEIAGRGKPFPDPYHKGAELLGIDPKDCVVVENAPLGIRSAKSAGIYCIAVAHTVPKEKLTEADEIFESIAEIKI